MLLPSQGLDCEAGIFASANSLKEYKQEALQAITDSDTF
jgi:hypothetical protein